MVYEGHTRFLPMDHPMRGRDRRQVPSRMTVSDWKEAWDDGKEFSRQGMKGLNVFFELPYWKELLINHLLDPMHCFKNVAVAVWQHICGQKDNYNSRAYLKEVNKLRRYGPHDNGQLPDAPWIQQRREKCIEKGD